MLSLKFTIYALLYLCLHCFFCLFVYKSETVSEFKFPFVLSQNTLGFLLFWSINVMKFIYWSPNVKPSVHSQNRPFLVGVWYSVNKPLNLFANILFGMFLVSVSINGVNIWSSFCVYVVCFRFCSQVGLALYSK